MNRKALSQVVSGIAVFGVLALLILAHAVGSGVLHVPATVTLVYGLLSPVIDQFAAWLIHGLAFGDWAIPVPGTISVKRRT